MLNKTNSWMIPAVALAVLILTPNVTSAQERKMKGKQMHHFFLGMKGELGLSDEQVSKLKALKSETEKHMIRTKADLKILEVELHDLLGENKVNVKDVDSKIEKIGELRTEIQKVHIHTRLDARKILTPEQLEKLHQQKGKKEMHEKRMGRKHKPG